MNEQVINELRRLSQQGQLTPAQVLEHAKDPASPLHGYITWDEGEAAAKLRLHEAGLLVRRVRVHIEQSKARDVVIKPKVTVSAAPRPMANDGTRKPFSATLEPHPDQAAAAAPINRLAAAVAELRTLKAKYADLAELGAVFAAIEQVKAGVPTINAVDLEREKLQQAVEFVRNRERWGDMRADALARAAQQFGLPREKVADYFRKAS
jgi:hypothetical protein